MKERKKGFALVLALVVIMLLVVFSTAVLSFATQSYVNTKKTEEINDLKLVAESGVEKGNFILKDYVLKHSEVLLKPESFKPEEAFRDRKDLKYPAGNGATCEIKFSGDEKYHDKLTGRDLDVIRITSTATSKKGLKKTAEVVLDKRGISNIYFDRLFKNSMTVAGGNFQCRDANLTLSGDAYFSGGSVQIPESMKFSDGNMHVKAKNFSTAFNPETKPVKAMFYIDDSVPEHAGWRKTSLKDVNALELIGHMDDKDSADEIQVLNNEDLADEKFICFKQQEGTTEESKKEPTLVTYKARKSGDPVDFCKLVNGTNLAGDQNGIYYSIVKKLKEKYPSNFLDMYGSFYKLIVIDGDVVIQDDKEEYNFDNYIIYCTGTVTFSGKVHFYNSSVFARNVTMDRSSEIEFQGVATPPSLAHEVQANKLKDFSPEDKQMINYYLINNLQNYGDYIEFKTVEWKEN